MSLTIKQQSNFSGFPKARELIEITGTHELEAQDRALLNLLLQRAHDSGRLAEDDAEWELPLAEVRQRWSRHESNDRILDCLKRLMRVVVSVPYVSQEEGEPRVMLTHLLDFVDTSTSESSKRNTVQFGIPKKLRPILARSERWGRIKAEVVCSMTSLYAIALYELVQARAEMQRCVETFSVERFARSWAFHLAPINSALI